MTKNPRLESVGATNNTAESVAPTIASARNPLERLTVEQLHEAYVFYVGRCRELRLAICQSLEAFAVADGLPPNKDPLVWSKHVAGSLKDALDFADLFFRPGEAEAFNPEFAVDELELVIRLKGQLEAELPVFHTGKEAN